ncbi:MAG TPA: tetratricopeptide repeat protein [Candidatus Cloacimonetes bacterium]|nr:tetratricopeptide repeat protein [Candidatus Cloacimonadota bacterium]
MKKIIYILSILILIPLLLCAKEYDLTAANSAYQEQNYQKAEEEYMKLVNEDVENFELFYNLGNTYFKLNNLGNARLYYEKAAKFKPLNAELNENIAMLLASIKDKEEVERSFIETLLRKIYYAFSINLLGVFIVIFFIVMMAFIVFLIMSRSAVFKRIVKVFLVIFAVIFFLVTVIEVMRIRDFYSDNNAVILNEVVIAYSGPSEEFPQVFTIHEGLKVTIERYDNDWVLIKLPSGNGGWILTSALGII